MRIFAVSNINNLKESIMEQLIIELKQQELENIYGGELAMIFLNGEWIEIEISTKKAD